MMTGLRSGIRQAWVQTPVNFSRAIVGAALAATLALSPLAMARGHDGSHSGGSHSSGSHSGSSHGGGSHSKSSHSSGSHSSGSHSSGKHNSGSHRSGSRSGSSHTSHAKSQSPRSQHDAPQTTHHNSRYAQGVKRDSHGKIARSQTAKNDFKKSHPCPSTGQSSGACKGYVIDHVVALKHGGADAPSNMQWQTKEAAKQKDKVE